MYMLKVHMDSGKAWIITSRKIIPSRDYLVNIQGSSKLKMNRD